MSVREQERRVQEAMHNSEEVEKRIEQRMQEAVHQANTAMLRAEEVRRRIEVGDVQPRPLPSLREDSLHGGGAEARSGSVNCIGDVVVKILIVKIRPLRDTCSSKSTAYSSYPTK